jgi:hypothetical protein
MKNVVKTFGQYVKESNNFKDEDFTLGPPDNLDSYPICCVSLDMVPDTLQSWADTLSELSRIAPNCEIREFSNDVHSIDVMIVGPRRECNAIAQYWNDLRGADETEVEPYRG